MADIKDPLSHPIKTDKGQKSTYFPEIPEKQELFTQESVRLGQRDILPTQIVDRLLGTGAVVLHALNDTSVHSGSISDAQHGARGTIDHAHDAANIDNVPAGGIASTDVQAAINELDTDKSATTHNHDHATLTNLNSASYTHLTSANHTDLTDGGNTTLHTHDIYLLLAGGTMTGAILMDGQQKIQFQSTDNFIYGYNTTQLHLACPGLMKLFSNTITIGRAATSDITLNFDTATNDGVITWVEASDYFQFSDDIMISDGENVILSTTTGTKIGTATNQKLGFWNATPVVQPSAYSVTNVTTDRTYDANSTTIDEIADVLGTLIADLQSIGLLG